MKMHQIVHKKGIHRGFLSRFVFVATFALTVGSQASRADVIAWWRFEDTNEGTGTTLTTQYNAPTLDATAGNISGQGLSGTIPSPLITTGSGGTAYGNTQSFAHIWAGGQNPVNSAGTMLLNDTFVNNQSSWTWEAFLNVDSLQYGYGMLFGNGDPTAHGFQLDLGGNDQSFRFLSGGAAPINTGTLFDFDTWYHIALVATWNGGSYDLNFYVDYASVATASNVTLDTLSADYSIFGSSNPAQAFLDEVRISDAALAPADFLYAVPEPGTVSALLMAGICALVIRRRWRGAASYPA